MRSRRLSDDLAFLFALDCSVLQRGARLRVTACCSDTIGRGALMSREMAQQLARILRRCADGLAAAAGGCLLVSRLLREWSKP